MSVINALPDGAADDIISLILVVPFLAFAALVCAAWLLEFTAWLIALPFSALFRAIRLIGWRIEIVNDQKPLSDGQSLHQGKFSETIFILPAFTAAGRLRNGIAAHLAQGGNPMDPAVGHWLAMEHGILLSHRVMSQRRPGNFPALPE